MERLEVLLGKYGEEGDKLLFKVLHRGDKLKRALENPPVSESDLSELGLRYDLTVPLARVAANYPEQLTRIFKRYQIQPVWRADRPAKGRFREFFQCDVDILGSSEILAELDIFCAIGEIMDELGLPDFELHINHRKWLSAFLRTLEIPAEQHVAVLGALDKLDKVGPDAVLSELQEKNLSEACRDHLPQWFARFSAKTPRNLGTLRNSWMARVRQRWRISPGFWTGMPTEAAALSGIRFWRVVWTITRDSSTNCAFPRFPPVSAAAAATTISLACFPGGRCRRWDFRSAWERLLDLLEERQALPPAAGHAQAVAIILDAAVLSWALEVVSAFAPEESPSTSIRRSREPEKR
jgi:hypothetical protein